MELDKSSSQSSQNLEENLKQERKSSKGISSEESRELDNSRENVVVAGTALDNLLILKEIFGHLGLRDLRSCCRVNKTWCRVGDPMVFEYYIVHVLNSSTTVTTTKGYVESEVQRRWSSMEDEIKHLEDIKRPVFIQMFLIWTSRVSSDGRELLSFVTRIGSMVYKLTVMDYTPVSSTAPFMNVLQYFTNVTDLQFYGNLIDEIILHDQNFPVNFPLLHVRKIYFSYCSFKAESYDDPAARILQLVPHAKEMYGVPMTMVKEFQNLGKLDTLRSVTVKSHSIEMTETEGMQMLVEAKMKFNSLWLVDLFDFGFNERIKETFKGFLELGKDTIEHFVIQPLEPTMMAKIVFPDKMPAVKHITLFGSAVLDKGCLHFEEGEDLSKRFPNVNTISFQDFTERMWSDSDRWWLPGGMFHSDNFIRKITCLKSNKTLEQNIRQVLETKFLSVRKIEIEPEDHFGLFCWSFGVSFPA